MANGILLDEDGDLAITDNGLVIGETDQQNVEAILAAHPGEFRHDPLLGVGIEDWLQAPLSFIVRRKLEREIAIQLETDNATDVTVDFSSDGTIEISATYV